MKILLLTLAFASSFSLGAQDILKGRVETTLISADSADTVVSFYDYAFYSTPTEAYQKSVNDFILNLVQDRIEDKKKKEVLEMNASLFERALQNFEKSYNSDKGEGALWSLEENIRIKEFESWVELDLSGWSYEGGAHGNGYQTFVLFSREDGRRLKIDDFFTNVDELNSIVGEVFRKERELTPDESLSEAGFEFENNKFSVNENFSFTGRSFTVYFNSYEIAPYAAGPTDLEISLGSLEHLLKMDM